MLGARLGARLPPDGSAVSINVVFDGWRSIHLFDTTRSQTWTSSPVPEAHDPAHAFDSGDLSVHEVATDPDEDLVYVPYYSAGFRALSYMGGSWPRSVRTSPARE